VPFGSRLGFYPKLSSNLLRSSVCVGLHSPPFLREPFKLTKLSSLCQLRSFLSAQGRSNSMLAYVPRMRISIELTGISSVQKYRAAQISKSDQRKAPEPVWLTGDNLLGPAMACSLRVSLQGFRGELPHLTQRTSFPLPSTGQAIRPPGGSTANFCNFPRVSETTLVCKQCV
jgi:hypothetical protein